MVEKFIWVRLEDVFKMIDNFHYSVPQSKNNQDLIRDIKEELKQKLEKNDN